MKTIDLFSGCGGISCGLSSAGFEVVAGADIERKYIQTFKVNFPDAKPLIMDLSKTDPQTLLTDLGTKLGELDLLAGGPPCPGFSKMSLVVIVI